MPMLMKFFFFIITQAWTAAIACGLIRVEDGRLVGLKYEIQTFQAADELKFVD